MNLFIAEKPSVAAAIAAELGGGQKKAGYIDCGDSAVTYCFGWLRELASPDHYLDDEVPQNSRGNKLWRMEDLPIVPKKWVKVSKKDAKKQISVIKQLIGECSCVINAGDCDREGSALVDDVIRLSGTNKPVKRFWVSAQDPISIQRGLNSLKPISQFKGWTEASEARQRADWLFGLNLTRAFTLKARSQGVDALLSVGRVQSPTLAMVVDRDRSRENFTPVSYTAIEITVVHKNGEFQAHWLPGEDQEGLNAEGLLIDPTIAAALAKSSEGIPGTIDSTSEALKKIPPPLPYSLASLTLAASNKFGMSAEDVLKHAQSLYEKKILSYPRTDNGYLPDNQFEDAGPILAAIAHNNPALAAIVGEADTSIKSRCWKSELDSAHHGIMPTQYQQSVHTISESERKLYDLVVTSYIAQFFPSYEYISTTNNIVLSNSLKFRASGKRVTVAGWKAVTGIDGDDDKDSQVLPVVVEGDSVTSSDVVSHQRKTKPLPAFTEGTLIQAMSNIHRYFEDADIKSTLRENQGIGTSATRAQIIGEMKRKQYLKVKGKSVQSTTLGRDLIDSLPDSLKSAVRTAENEHELKKIENQEASIDTFLQKQEKFIHEQIQSMADIAIVNSDPDTSNHECPACEKPLRKRKSAGKQFWGCSAYPECTASLPDKAGAPDYAYVRQKAVLSEHNCKECSKSLVKRHNKKKDTYFWGCSGYPNCKKTYEDNDGSPVLEGQPETDAKHRCARCEKPLRRISRQQGHFWGCTGYPGCKNTQKDLAGVPEY